MPKVETSFITNSRGISSKLTNLNVNVSIGNSSEQGNFIIIKHTKRETNSTKHSNRRVVKKLIRKRPVINQNETLHSDHSFSVNSFTSNKISSNEKVNPHRRRLVVTKKRLIKPTISSDESEATKNKRRRVVVTKKRLLTKATSTISNDSSVEQNEVSSTIESQTEPSILLDDYDYEEEESIEVEPEFETIFDTNFFILPSTSKSSLIPTPSTTIFTSLVYETKTLTTTRLRTYTFIVTRVNGDEQIVTSTTEVKPQLKTLTITDAQTLTITATLDLTTSGMLPSLPMTSKASSDGPFHHYTDTEENEGRRLIIEEPRYNLATRIMSNGVEVIVAGDKSTLPGEPNIKRVLSTPTRPMTLPPSTLSDHMMMLLPQDASGVAHLSSSLYKNQFVTKTCLTTYTYLTTYLENGSTTISSHEQVVSNIATEERNLATKVAVTPTTSSGFTLTQNSNLATGVFHTTYTYLYTIMDDEQPLVITSKHTVANTVTAPDDYLSLLQPSEAATPTYDTNTYLSTVELTKTLTEGKREKVISTKDIVTQVVITESIPPKGTSVMTSYIALDVEDIAPTATREYTTTNVVKTYFVTYTYYNTYLENGKTVVKTNVSTSSDIVTEKLYLNPKKTQLPSSSSSKNVINTSPINNVIKTKQKSEVPIEIFATKTYQTTYTYFTTFLQDSKQSSLKSPIVSSNTRTIENIVTEKLENDILDSSFVENLGKSLEKKALKSIITIATLLSGEEIEITAVNKLEIKPTKSALISPASVASPLTQTMEDKFEPSSPSIITGSTIIFQEDDDPFGNFFTPALNSKPSKVVKSTIKNELSSLLSSEIVKDDQSIIKNSQNYVTSILGSKTIISNGATLQAGDPVIVVNNKKGNSTIIPVSDPNKKKINKNSSNKNTLAKPATNNVSNLLGSIDINSLTAFGSVLNRMAGLIQTNLKQKRIDNTSSIITPYNKVTTSTTTQTPSVDAQNRAPIYIPVGGFADDVLDSAESQNIANFDLNLPPQINPEHKWINEENKYKNPVIIGKPTHESPLVNGGIPISPGQVITANSDVIVGKPAILGPRLPTFNKNKGPHHEDEVPLGIKPPPPPKSIWPKRHNDLFIKDSAGLQPSTNIQNHGPLLNVPAIPLQHFKEQEHDTIPHYANINLPINNYENVQYKLNVVENDNAQKTHQWFGNIQPTKSLNQESQTIVFAKPIGDTNLKPPVGDPISLPEVIERSTGQHLLVNIQPSQVANVIIPHGSTTALIFGGAAEPHKNGQYFDDPSPYPEPEIKVGFTGVNIQENVQKIPVSFNQFGDSHKPVSGVISVDSSVHHHHGVDVNVPALSFAHDINLHAPPISFGMVNHGDDLSAHIINHGNQHSSHVSHDITNNKNNDDIVTQYSPSNQELPNSNRPISFHNQNHKIIGGNVDYIANGDININVSPQPLPNLKEHVVPNGIVLDASLDKSPNHHFTRPHQVHNNQKHPYIFEKLTPPPNFNILSRPPNNFASNINPLEIMTPPPIGKSKPPFSIRSEIHSKPVTIPLKYEHNQNHKNNIQHNHDVSVFKPDDYSSEDLEDSKEDENEDGEVIQESKTRPLRPGQVPYEILKVNTTTTSKPTTATRKSFVNKNITPARPITTTQFKKIPISSYHVNVKPNSENPRPFRITPDRFNKHNSHLYHRNQSNIRFPVKEETHRHNPYIPFGTLVPNKNYNKPIINTPRPNKHEHTITTIGYKVFSPHFSTSMPIKENKQPSISNNPIIGQGNHNVHSYRPTSMPVDPRNDISTTRKPIYEQFEKVYNTGTQTEQPFNSIHTKIPIINKPTTQKTISFSNKDVVTTVDKLNLKPATNNYKRNNTFTTAEKVDQIYNINYQPPSKDKIDLFENTEKTDLLNQTTMQDLDIKKLEQLVPPKIETTSISTIKFPDIDMKPPREEKISPPKAPTFEFPLLGNTLQPILQTPSEEMKPPPVVVHNEPVMGLSPPPMKIPQERPVSTHRPILAETVEISTYRPVFTFPKTTKEVPPYNFETPTENIVDVTSKRLISTTRKPVGSTTRIYTRYSTNQKPIGTTVRPIFRWTKPFRTTTYLTTQEKYIPSTNDIRINENVNVSESSSTIRPTSVKVKTSSSPSMEIIIGHPTLHETSISTENILREQNEHYNTRKSEATRIEPTTTVKNKSSTVKIINESRNATISNKIYTQDDIIPSIIRQQEYNTRIHHAGNEIKIVDDSISSTSKLLNIPTQIKESKIILPTKYITHTQTLTVTTTKTTVVKSLGAPPSTLTLLVTKTRTSTIVDTVTQTQTLVKPTSIIETITTTINHTPTPEIIPDIASTYPAFPVQATAVLQPEIIPTITNDNDLNEFIINETDPPKVESSSESSLNENESIFVVLTDKKPGSIKVPNGNSETIKVDDLDHPHRDEVLSNDVNRVLLGGILIASPPSLESPDIVPPGVSNECRPDCKASRNELCQRVEGIMRCVCRPGFARMFPDRPCKPTYTYHLKIVLSRYGKEVLQYEDTLADPSSPQFIRLAAATHEGLDRMVMQSDLRDIYHGVQVNGFEPHKGEGVLNDFYLQLSDNTDETRLKEVFKKYLRHSNYSLGGTEIFAAREFVENLDALDFDECTNIKFHDCSEHAQCFNLRGTYTCSCKEGFSDLSENPLYPGRICSAELIGCERCHYHGTCYSRGDEQVLCECFQWYAGESCHINLKVLLIALVTLGAILFTLLLICIVLTCVKRRRPEHTSIANGMSFFPHRAVVGGRRSGTLDRRAMIQDTSSEGSDTLPYVQKKNKKLKGALKKPSQPEPENDASNLSFVEQRDRSLTVMIPRAKYHPAPTTSQVSNITTFDKRKNSVASSNETKLLSYLDAGPSPNKDIVRRKPSNTPSECIAKTGRKISTGALVSAGFEVSATVGVNNMGTLGTIATTCGTEADRSENATLIQKISADLLSSTGTQSQFTTLRNTIKRDDKDDLVDNWLDITPRIMTISEARSYDETTIQPPTKSLRSGYDSKPSSQNQNNDEANTMAERDLGSTFLLPHTHLYKPDRGSDISGFDSL